MISTMQERRRGDTLVAATVVLALIAIAALLGTAIWKKASADGPSWQDEAEEEDERSVGSSYERVEFGMSDDQAIALLGKPVRRVPIRVDRNCPKIPAMYKRGKMEALFFVDEEDRGLFGGAPKTYTVYVVDGRVVPEPGTAE